MNQLDEYVFPFMNSRDVRKTRDCAKGIKLLSLRKSILGGQFHGESAIKYTHTHTKKKKKDQDNALKILYSRLHANKELDSTATNKSTMIHIC
jgi:hypothetical protein